MPLSYRDAGVDRDRAHAFVTNVRARARITYGANVVPYTDSFAGLYELPARNGDAPLLAATCDGVGTKLVLAQALCRYQEVGQDLVAVNVNDLLPCGATPLFFLNYIATAKIRPEVLNPLMDGMVAACQQAGCALLGGETAEMPDLYPGGGFDLAGFAVGMTARQHLPPRHLVKPGDKVLGLPSSGVHANGFSLARRAFANAGLQLCAEATAQARAIGEELLRPTAIYVQPVLDVLAEHRAAVKAAAHVTGGGLLGRALGLLPAGCRLQFDRQTLPRLSIFDAIAEAGPVTPHEMASTFNLGLGFLLVVDEKSAPAIVSKDGSPWIAVGRITAGDRGVELGNVSTD